MADVNLNEESNVVLTAGTSVEVLDAFATRKGFTLQLQGPGFAWVRFGGAAAKNNGLRIGAWQIVSFPEGGELFRFLSSAEYYVGAVNVYYEGGVADGQNVESANMRVLEYTPSA